MDQVFTLFDAVQSDNENDKHEFIKDSDTEIIAPEEIKLTDNPGNESVLTLEPNVHFVD